MTAVVQNPEKKIYAASFSFIPMIGITLAVMMLLGFFVLPWVNQPDLGATTAMIVTASRDNNELRIPLEGMVLIPPAAVAALGFAIWNAFKPRYARTTALLTFIAGLLSLVYFVNVFRDVADKQATYLDAMGAGFWMVLAAGVGMVLYVVLPRARYAGYEVTRTLSSQENVLALSLVLLVIVVGIANPRFLAERNISDVLQGHAYVAVAAIGMSMVIISGNIDISVGSLIGVLATISGTLAVSGAPIWVSWIAPLVVGALVGALIGFMVAYLRIPSIIVTLGMLSILKGGLISVTNGAWITDMPPDYFLAQQRPMGIPMPVIFMIVLTILAAIWMRYSATGRAIYAVGGNKEAARLSGISERGIIMRVFIINGVFVGISSLLFATQLSIIQSTVPPNLELLIITSAVVGGVSILGGTGTAVGSTIAAVLLNTIRSAMVFINVSPFWLQAVQGVLILTTVLADLIRRRRQN